jgi:hypothetical protein
MRRGIFAVLGIIALAGCHDEARDQKMAEASCQISAQEKGDKAYRDAHNDGGHASMEDIAGDVRLCMQAHGFDPDVNSDQCKQAVPDYTPGKDSGEDMLALTTMRILEPACYKPM